MIRRIDYVAVLMIISLLSAQSSAAQESSKAPSGGSAGRPQKTATAVRISNGSINVDGRLNEAVWASIPPLRDFVQKEPIEGATPTDQLEIRLAYDDEALYVATHVRSKDPLKIQAPMSRRDNIHQAEHIWISLDTYHDRRTAYSFAIAASGVRGDWYHARDDENAIDLTFDPVWQAAAQIDSTGWTGEMRIPFSQLRFNAADEQVWGVNFDFWSPSRNEDVFWIPVPKKESGWSSWMGTLTGIRGIKPTRRVELMPYVASDATTSDQRNPGNPFEHSTNYDKRVGADMKMGVGPNLTLQATVNPDFGQVEADPSQVNLSAFETFFDEKRPFFTEGSQIFNANGGNYFYSRRIGARPRGEAVGDFVDYPDATTIWGAAKLTGQLASRTSVGVLAAVTGGEKARTFTQSTNQFADTLVAPRTTYAVGRVSQQFGKNQSTIGAILTGVVRDLANGSPLGKIMNRSAITGGTDWNVRFKGNTYQWAGWMGFSHVEGDTAQIANLQRSSARYFQRPDAKSYHFDPSRTSLTGFNGGTEFEKNAGKHWLYGAAIGFESPSLDFNDAGRLSTADGINGGISATFRETTPKAFYRSYSFSLEHDQERNYDSDVQFATLRWDGGFTFRNFWTLSLTAWHDFEAQDERLTRGGPSMAYPHNRVGIISLSNAASSKTRWNGRIYYGRDGLGALTNRLSGLLSFKPGPRWNYSISPNFLREQSTRQWVQTLNNGRPVTYGNRYVFAFIDQTVFTSVMRLNYALTPDLTVEVYGEPFAASGRYSKWGELSAPRALALRTYGTDGTTIATNPDGSHTVTDNQVLVAGSPAQFTIPSEDFNVRSWRSNLVFRWEYRRGSTLYVVWQQNREGFSPNGDLVSFGGLVDPFRGKVGRYGFSDPVVTHEMTNFFAVKVSYWLPM